MAYTNHIVYSRKADKHDNMSLIIFRLMQDIYLCYVGLQPPTSTS
jgi:hypothetical protein